MVGGGKAAYRAALRKRMLGSVGASLERASSTQLQTAAEKELL